MRRRQQPALPPAPAEVTENWLDKATHRRIIVHTVAGSSIEGTITVAADDGLVLWAARMLVDPKPVDLAGEVFIPRAQVLLIQTVRM